MIGSTRHCVGLTGRGSLWHGVKITCYTGSKSPHA